jgi:hypothetical protein
VPVKVRLIGDLRRFADVESIETEGGCTLGTALDGLARQHPRLGTELFDGQGRLHYAVVLMVGDRRVTWPDDGDTPIEDGQQLMLTRFHAGG